MKYLRIIFFAMALIMAATPAFASSLYAFGNYNVFVFGDYTHTSDQYNSTHIEGRLAAQGTVSTDSLTVGQSATYDASTPSLVAGGGVNFSTGNVYNGALEAGGTINGPNYLQYNTYPVIENSNPLSIDFTAAASYYSNLSATLKSAVSTASSIVYNLSSMADITATWVAEALGALSSGNSLIVNVGGVNGSLSGGVTNPLLGYSSQILYNFYEATSLELSKADNGLSVAGSILAPLADVTAVNGNMNGTLIAKSMTGGFEFHDVAYTGNVPTPIPGSIALLGTGLAGLLGWRRRRR